MTHPPRPNRPLRFRPRLEVLEGRTLPATLTVTTLTDGGSGSLRDAVARAQPGDTVNFDPSAALLNPSGSRRV